MGHLELMQEEWNRINDEVKHQRSERNNFRNDHGIETALQVRLESLQNWMNGKGYSINITDAIDNYFNEFEFVHDATIKNLEDRIEVVSGSRPILGE